MARFEAGNMSWGVEGMNTLLAACKAASIAVVDWVCSDKKKFQKLG
jgi:hypothetical protein